MATLRSSFLLITLVILAPNCLGASPPAESAALEAAQRRQEYAKTWDIRFTIAEWLAEGAESELSPGGMLKPTHAVPEKEITLRSSNRIACDGERIRIEYNHPQWLLPQGQLRTGTSLGIFDGNLSKELYATMDSREDHPWGAIRLGAPWYADHPHLIPLMYTFRPFTRKLSGRWAQEIRATGSALPLGGDPCLEFILKSPRSSTSFWLDQGKDYVVRRKVRRIEGKIHNQLDIVYRPQGNPAIWIPDSWVSNTYAKKGDLIIASKGKVTEARINAPILAGEFDLPFPAGTIVTDNRDNSRMYRVDANGGMREIDPFNHRDVGWLSIAQPGEAWYRRHTILLLLVSGLVAGCGALIIGWWRRRKVAAI